MSELIRYTCPCCGGTIEYDSSSQSMKCPYCDTEFEEEALKGYEAEISEDSDVEAEWDEAAQSKTDLDGDGLVSYICEACGGEIVTDTTTAATSCPFCSNPVIMKGNVSGMVKPDLVIPFKIDKKAAKEALLNFYKGKPLLPRSFSDENHIDEIKGVYVPFWLYSCEADANMRFRATRVRAWSDSKYHYTETSYFAVTRAGTLDFSSVPVDGSSKMADDIMESIEPYNYSEAVDFSTAYLSGFFADKYDVTSEVCNARANERIKNTAASVLRSTVQGFSSVTEEHSSIRYNRSYVKYALLPVWLLNTTYNGEKYTFAMNGQSGRFVGNLPVDKGTYLKYFALVAGIAAAAAFAVTFLIM